MKQFAISLILAALLACAGTPAGAQNLSSSEWLDLIKADFDRSCAVELIKVGSTVSGNNGYRSEQWFMQTCEGRFEYWVTYYSAVAFPNRARRFEVTRVSRLDGAQPNNSFKPNPHRGSARVLFRYASTQSPPRCGSA